ncbi:hypothetical protein ACFW9O_06060 [Streptomyces sp. NPDC059499]|uniref:hypothetical protein n=1 Tax=Streptomyces sp. NPDC059499 TaxID=3346852 RepID=UPI0036881A1C
MTTTGSGTPRPGLTINVYRVDAKTGDRTPLKQYETVPANGPSATGAYPPCTCPRCR